MHFDNKELTVKCFTFFNYLKKLWKDVKFNLDEIHFIIRMKIDWRPPHLFDNLYLAMHSPNLIPEYEVGKHFVEVKTCVTNKVTFSKMSVNVKYESDCHDSDHGDEQLNDCLAICVMKMLQNNRGDSAVFNSNYLIRKEYSRQLKKFNASTDYKIIREIPLVEMKQNCTKQCKPDCQYSHFLYGINTEKPRDECISEKHAYLVFQHNHLPDLYIRHLPETTFISFISNFGGLIGMWLGLSAFLILDTLSRITKSIIACFRKIKSKISINNQQVIINLNAHIMNRLIKVYPNRTNIQS